MRREMDELRNAVKEKAVDNLDGIIQRMNWPFTTKVLNHPFPLKFCLPQLESFDGSRVPLDHIKSFKTLMPLQMISNEVMCKVFPTTLKGAARVWFAKLPSGTIANFEQLSKGFFVTSLKDSDIRSQLGIFSTSAKQRENHWDSMWHLSIKSYYRLTKQKIKSSWQTSKQYCYQEISFSQSPRVHQK